MRVILSVPFGWHASTLQGVVTYVAPPARELLLHVGALVVCPEDLEAWRQSRWRADLAPAAVTTVVATSTLETTAGWRAEVAQLAVTGPAGELVEHRLVAIYRFLHTAAAVLVRSRRDAGELAAADVRAALASAQPDFRTGEPIALAELWT